MEQRFETQAARAAALFASHLSTSATATRTAVNSAIHAAVRRYGNDRGCTAVVAAEYGEHPECAAARMRWALDTVAAVYSV